VVVRLTRDDSDLEITQLSNEARGGDSRDSIADYDDVLQGVQMCYRLTGGSGARTGG